MDDVDACACAQPRARRLRGARREQTEAAEATWFDLLTSAAFLIFRDAGVEWAAVEVGLGGRLDSDQCRVYGEVAVVTNVEPRTYRDSRQDARRDRGREDRNPESRRRCWPPRSPPDDEAGAVAQATGGANSARIVRVDVRAGATIEETNVALAGEVLDDARPQGGPELVRPPVGAELLDRQARAAARLIGRMERVEASVGASRVKIVFDGAHVPFNLAAVLSDLARDPDLASPCVAVVALASDKDAAGFLAELAKRATIAVFTSLPSASRGRTPSDLAALAASIGLASEIEPDPKRAFRRGLALAAKANGWLLVTGSLYLVGDLRGEVLA